MQIEGNSGQLYQCETDVCIIIYQTDYCGENNLNTGTPLIGRFLGPAKNHLNSNPSY